MKPEWLIRAEEEQQLLQERITRLSKVLAFGDLSLVDSNDLFEQRKAMIEYNAALSRRIKRHGGTVVST